MRSFVRLLGALVAAVAVAVLAPLAGAGTTHHQHGDATHVFSTLAFTQDPSPVLIQKAMRAGTLDFGTGHVYLARALFAPELLPAEYRSATPFDGTLYLLKVKNALPRLSAAQRSEVEALTGLGGRSTLAVGPGTGACELSPLPTVNVHETAHFYIEYNEAELIATPDGLTIADYASSLEHAWEMEITKFGWAKPPVGGPLPAPNGKYLVKIMNLGPVLYGYVANFGTSAGEVGNNPATSWNDKDAYASCMGLNSDYSQFPGTPRRALDATTAHEFNHSIQFGIGALAGDNVPDDIFVEGGATWMEDEAYDSANDNYNYLWPTFEDDMGEYADSPYPYWITFRGLTERFGASQAGAGEDVMQRFWELTSQNKASNLTALDQAMRQTKRRGLAEGYHAYAIAVKFNKTCGGLFTYPHCFEEGRKYVNGDGVQSGAGETSVHGSIANVGGSFSGGLPDNYALNWIALPESGDVYTVTFRNTSAGGTFRVSLVCDTGSALKVLPFAADVGGRQAQSVQQGWRRGCQQRIAVVTNITQTAANPGDTANRPYTLSTSLGG